MVKSVLKSLNDNHWYIIAAALLGTAIFWAYGCESKCKSLIDPQQLVNRSELQNELNYLIGQAKAREENLDKQDAVKQALLDSVNIMSSEGSINPSGLLNLAATIGGISFGLSQRQNLNAYKKKTTAAAVNASPTDTA